MFFGNQSKTDLKNLIKMSYLTVMIKIPMCYSEVRLKSYSKSIIHKVDDIMLLGASKELYRPILNS